MGVKESAAFIILVRNGALCVREETLGADRLKQVSGARSELIDKQLLPDCGAR